MRIALDAMGGDHAPGPIVKGAVEATRDQPGLTVALVGPTERIVAELANFPEADRERLPIVEASEFITMEDKPVEALRRKRDNSIAKCWGMMARGEVKAVVSAGNTGAMVAAGLMNAKMYLPGVRRPGIAAIFPSHQGPIVIMDVGANLAAKPEDLYQYGVMGAIYSEYVLGVTAPRIGLLNVGSEEGKGNDLVRAAFSLFQQSHLANRFVGHVEGRDLYEGHARVVVCEGFVGNVLLKAGEGAVEFLFSVLKQELAQLTTALPGDLGLQLRDRLGRIKTRFEYQEFGGAPLLGIQGSCIICHGSSGDRAIHNALRVAATMAEVKLNDRMLAALAESSVVNLPSEPNSEPPGSDANPA